MNPYIRQAARALIGKKGLNQTSLADDADITRANVSKALNGNIGQIPKVWRVINNEIDAEMLLIPKQDVEKVIREIYGDSVWYKIQSDLVGENN